MEPLGKFTGYLSSPNPYFGATIGRVANRIYPTEFSFKGQNLSLSKNMGEVHLHGGFKGFDKVRTNFIPLHVKEKCGPRLTAQSRIKKQSFIIEFSAEKIHYRLMPELHESFDQFCFVSWLP